MVPHDPVEQSGLVDKAMETGDLDGVLFAPADYRTQVDLMERMNVAGLPVYTLAAALLAARSSRSSAAMTTQLADTSCSGSIDIGLSQSAPSSLRASDPASLVKIACAVSTKSYRFIRRSTF